MTDAAQKPDLGRFGSFGRGVTPEQAKDIEALGYGAVWVGGSPPAELDWVEPILEKTTSLREMNFSGNIRYSLTERGRELGRLVWVPRAVVPYVGAGAGALLYKLEQVGDFVDFVDLSVFPSVFESHAWAPSAQVFGGVDVRVLKRVYVTVDGRYLWAASDLGRDFIDFDPIDLAGFRLSGGVNFIF